MHPAQRRAIAAMINSLETQLGAIKGLIVADFDLPEQPKQTPSPSGRGDYLTDDEEAKLEALLEAERQEALKKVGDAFLKIDQLGETDG
jgi:hypothetical protein